MVERLQAEIASRDAVIEQFKESTGQLATWLGNSHAYLDVLLGWMERAQGNIPLELTKLIKKTRENLTLQQDAFLKEYGDLNKPGQN
jgi:hypothetical protein